jgi:Domain of unknown function (DUF4258)
LNREEEKTMRTFYPVPDNIASGADKLRNRILESYYTLSTHASARMAERGIALDEVMNCIKKGNVAGPSAREKKENFFCVVFYHGKSGEELIVPVRAAFGDYNAKPIILTVYRNSTDDYVPEGDIDDVAEHIVVEKPVVKAPDDMTDEELEAALSRRREAKAKKARLDAEAKLQALLSQQARMLRDRRNLERDLADIEAEIEKTRA